MAREYAIATLSMDAAGVCDVAAKELRKGRNCGDSPSGPPAEANDYVFEATPGDVEVGPQKALVEISYKFHYVGSDPSQAQDNGLQLTNTGHGQVTLTRENGEWRVASDTLEDNQG